MNPARDSSWTYSAIYATRYRTRDGKNAKSIATRSSVTNVKLLSDAGWPHLGVRNATAVVLEKIKLNELYLNLQVLEQQNNFGPHIESSFLSRSLLTGMLARPLPRSARRHASNLCRM
jgi:hypothetical protein